MAAIVATIAGSLYVATVCPTVFWYDSAEYAAAAYTLGIPHPPGYPLYTLIGYGFAHLTDEPALGLNLMSSGFAAAAVAMVYGLTRGLGFGRPAAICAGAALAQNPVFWRNAVVAEVYTPALAALAGVWWLAVVGWRRDRARTLVIAAFVAGLSLGFHLFIATTGLGLAALVASFRAQGPSPTTPAAAWRVRVRLAGMCAAATLLGTLVFLWVPLRAAMDPAINFEDPSSLERFWWLLSGGQYKHWFVAENSWARALGITRILLDYLSWPGLMVAVTGLAALIARARWLGIAVCLGIAGNIWFFFDYRVHDVEVFFLPAGLLMAVTFGVAVDTGLATALGNTKIARMGMSALMIAWLGIRLWTGFGRNDLAHYDDARQWAERACAELPPAAIIVNYTTFPEWKYDAVFRSYYQIVLGQRTDVTVWLAPPPAAISHALASGAEVFAYHDVPMLTAEFVVRPAGAFHRVTAPE